MLDYACVFTTGGVVLWQKAFCQGAAYTTIVNNLIKNVLLDDKATSHKNTYAHADSVLRWKI